MATLVVLAAGLGRRYGGLKQLAPIGEHGETIVDYTLRDARDAGFSCAVVVVRPEIARAVRAHVDERAALPIHYAQQMEARGTADAVLAARDAVHEPFAVINADDYFGPGPLTELRRSLDLAERRPHHAVAVLYPVVATLPHTGFVVRARCATDGNRVTGLVELTVQRDGTGDGTGVVTAHGERVAPDTPVSMNLWGFHPAVFDDLAAWVAAAMPDSTGEHRLTDFVDTEIAAGSLQVDALRATGGWFGITWPSDLPAARAAARALTPIAQR